MYGAERATAALLSGLHAADGVDVRVLLIEEARLGEAQSEFAEHLQSRGVPVETVLVQGVFSRFLCRRLKAWALDGSLDVVHTIGPKATVYAWGTLRRMPLKRVSTLHGWLFRGDLKERLHEWIELQALKRFDRIVVLTRFYRDWLTTHGVREERLALIPTGVPGALAERARKDLVAAEDDKGCTVGMFGRFSEEKRHDLFVAAASLVLNECPGTHFLVAGSGPLEGTVRRQIEEECLDKHIALQGYVSPEDFFSEVDVLAVCSDIENLPFSILEAMAEGVPVVGTDAGGISDAVEDGKTGFLVPRGDSEAMARRLIRLVADADLRRKQGLAAKRRLLSVFDLSQAVEAHVALYAGMAERGIS